MSRRKLTEPRYVKPENVEVGDYIRVAYPTQDGVQMHKTGRVGRREDHGHVRHVLTSEGGRLFTWEPDKPAVRVTLIESAPAPQEALFEM